MSLSENQIDIIIVDVSMVTISVIIFILYRIISRANWRSRMRRDSMERLDEVCSKTYEQGRKIIELEVEIKNLKKTKRLPN